ncbi:MAG TPA: hypothetical protein VGI74_15495 [Streptosporangiaceae bacterium]
MKASSVRARWLKVTAVVAMGVGLATAPMSSSHAGPVAAASASVASSSLAKIPVFTLPLKKVGQVNLSALAKSQHRTRVAAHRQGAAITRPAAGSTRHRIVDQVLITHRPKGTPKTRPSPATVALSGKNVPGEHGFSAMGGIQQAQTTGGRDLEPPDQGLCAGGGYVMEFINDAIAVYDGNGDQLVAPVSSVSAFRQPTADFFADPRCYYDAATKHWFFQEFISGTVNGKGKLVVPSTQFEAVSNTADPTGSYTVYSWNTSDSATAGCPCFGDYDNLGADANGIYVATDEFGLTSGFNGVVIYAISKEQIENAATTGILPPVFGYRLTHDPFGQPLIVAPTSTPPGAKFARNTEYFVESNGDALNDNHLMVYALLGTDLLGNPAPPKMVRTEVSTEAYAVPANAMQKPGPRPLGKAFQEPAGTIQTDFDAEMEPTYAGGQIYAELDTGTASGSSAVDWFILKPTLTGSKLSAGVAHQGVVAVKDTSLLYPYTAVDAQGVGYLLFSLSGPGNYPSPAYIAYGATGPTGPVIVATPGSAPADGFTCYPAFVGPFEGGCRWGDYSMGAVMNGRVYMSTEMIPQGFRDTLTNWSTFIWSAPPPAQSATVTHLEVVAASSKARPASPLRGPHHCLRG